MKTIVNSLLIILFLSFLPVHLEPTAREKEKKSYRIPEVAGKVKINGRLDEAFWSQALQIPLAYELMPGENIAPPVKTMVYAAYSKTHLYIAFQAFDPSPGDIRARLTDRDNISKDDYVGISLDTFNDRRHIYSFWCNPYGIQADLEETESGSSDKWDALWDSAGRIDQKGYTVEMAIPFQALRFQRKKGEAQVWGFDAYRSYPRSLKHYLGIFRYDRGNSCFICQLPKISGFKGIKAGKNIEISPSFSAMLTHYRHQEDENDKYNPGLTAHWGFTPNLTLSTTVNPDFSNVEADVAQLDINTQFALYYPEKRSFFLESGRIFETPFSAVYTRSLADPEWGVKLTGKEGAHSIGFFSVRDGITNLLFPGPRTSDNATMDRKSLGTVLRYRMDIGKASNVGLLVSDREGKDYYNRLIGADTLLRLNRKKHISFQFMASRTRYPGEVAADYQQDSGAFNGTALELVFNHAGRNIGYYGTYRHVSNGFRADLGYMPQSGFRHYNGGLMLASYRNPGHWYTYMDIDSSIDYEVDWDNNLIYKSVNVSTNYQGALQSNLTVVGTLGKRSYLGTDFNTNHGEITFSIRPNRSLAFGLSGIFGNHIDFTNARQAKRILLNGIVDYKFGTHLSVRMDHIYERLTVNSGWLYTAHVSNLKIVYQFNRRAFLRTILQYLDYRYNVDNYIVSMDPQFKHLFSQILFSYKVSPRTMLFLGYSDNHYGYYNIPLAQSDRTFFLKIGYALVM